MKVGTYKHGDDAQLRVYVRLTCTESLFFQY